MTIDVFLSHTRAGLLIGGLLIGDFGCDPIYQFEVQIANAMCHFCVTFSVCEFDLSINELKKKKEKRK